MQLLPLCLCLRFQLLPSATRAAPAAEHIKRFRRAGLPRITARRRRPTPSATTATTTATPTHRMWMGGSGSATTPAGTMHVSILTTHGSTAASPAALAVDTYG